MNIPLKYEDVVAKLDAAMIREAALREELYQAKEARDAEMLNGVRTQQRLTVAEQKLGYAYDWGYSDGQNYPNGYSDKEDRDKCVAELLKPAAEQRAAVMEKALSRIAREHDCGCSPCTGSCTSQVALEITVDAMRDIAIAALKQADGEVS